VRLGIESEQRLRIPAPRKQIKEEERDPEHVAERQRGGGATFGNIALQKMAEYSKNRMPPISAATIQPSPSVMPGMANHIPIMLGMPMSSVPISHGLRRPPASAMAPSTGAVTATSRPAPEVT
jgi:hypothetical protein